MAKKHSSLVVAGVLSLSVSVLTSCMGYMPGHQAYWDGKVKELCKKDGGVHIIERLRISRSDIKYLGRVDGKIGVPAKELAHSAAPAYSELKITEIRESNPHVSRSESTVIRRIDQAVIARWVVYSRSGGDLPTGFSEGTNFVCPDLKEIRSDLEALFIVDDT